LTLFGPLPVTLPPKRYFKNNPLFALKIAGQLCGLKKHPME
jgi:hypothetical protein